MPTRTILINLTEQVPQARSIKFLPDLTSADDTLVLSRYYTVTTDALGVGSIDLPTKASGSIKYRYEIPRSNGVSKGVFFLSAGAAIELDDLIAAGGFASDTVIDYVDEQIAIQETLILALGSGVACVPIVCSDRITPIPVATNIMSRIVPRPFQLLDLVSYLTQEAATGTFTVDVKLNGVSVLSTLLTIDAGEQSSITAAVPVVFATVDFARGAEITIDVTDDADGTATGLVVELIGVYVPPDTEAPTVPASITATTVSASEIDLDWDASTDNEIVSGYTLQRATNAGFTTGVTAFVLGNVLAYSDTGRAAATEYWYRVKARDASGNESAYSTSDSATTSPANFNVALASNGSTATASSTHTGGPWGASKCIDGLRHTNNSWLVGGNGWNSVGTPAPGSPEWVEVDFGASRTINQIDVFTLADAVNYNTDPTLTDTVAVPGNQNFTVEYWNGSSWVVVTGGTVTSNDKVWRQFTFSPVSTTKIRVSITQSADAFARLIEIEAWGY